MIIIKVCKQVGVIIVGLMLCVIGITFGILAIGTTIVWLLSLEGSNSVVGNIFIFAVICGTLGWPSVYFVRTGFRSIRKRRVIFYVSKAERLKENKLREFEFQQELEKRREEACIRQKKYALEQLELQKQLDEQGRMKAIKDEEEKREAERIQYEKHLKEQLELKRKANRFVFLTDEQIERLEQRLELPKLQECELILQHGEVAVYGTQAMWYANQNLSPYRGNMHITNQRVGFVSGEKGFIINHRDIVAVGKKDTSGIILQAKQCSYSLDMPRSDLAYLAFKALRSGGCVSDMADKDREDEILVGDVSLVDKMEGHEFEHYCAELLGKLKFTGVEVTKSSGDQGVDILAEKNGVKYAIQCKNYSSKLGNTPIQEVNAGKIFYNCHVGVVMTNSTFTPAAQALANATNVLLWDRKVLDEYIRIASGRK